MAEVCSSMKYPKRCQYKHAKQKKYHEGTGVLDGVQGSLATRAATRP